MVTRGISKDQRRQRRLVRHFRLHRGKADARRPNLAPRGADIAPGFDPYETRRRLDVLQYTIGRKLEDGSYEPRPALDVLVPKPDGDVRTVCRLTLPDHAASVWFLRKMLAEHDHKFSRSAFGHRHGGGTGEAVAHIRTLLLANDRRYVVEVDFKGFFDTIDVAYVLDVMRRCLGASDADVTMMERFLRQPRASTPEDYKAGRVYVPERGVPQGSPISMFAGNLACFELDRDLEQLGVAFARFADDSAVLCDSFAQADEVMSVFRRHCRRAGLTMHPRKSPGISLLSSEPSPFPRLAAVEFVGRRISVEGVALSPSSVKKLKARLKRLIHKRLIALPRLAPPQAPARAPDRFGAGLARALERLLYGGVAHDEVVAVLNGGTIRTPPKRMSGYLLMPDQSAGPQLRQLDAWLVKTVLRGWKRRVEIAAKRGVTVAPLTKTDLAAPGESTSLRIPAVFFGWRYVQIWNRRFPKQRLVAPEYGVEDDDDDLDDDNHDGEHAELLDVTARPDAGCSS